MTTASSKGTALITGASRQNNGIGHVGLRATNPAASAEFYRDILGMEIVGGSAPDHPLGATAFLSSRPDEESHEIALFADPASDLAVVLDLPGDEAVRWSLALALRGFRPVPVIDGSPGPDILGNSQAVLGTGPALSTQASVAVDMRQTLRWLCIGATVLPTLKISPNASPVFLLDALRMGRVHTPGTEVFDNRWKTFPQDFPSARFLKERGIRRVLLIQDMAGQPSEDLAHVLLRWQEAGISIHAGSAADINANKLIHVNRPTRFRTLRHRALALIGLSRAASGGFGAWPHGSGGG